MTIDVAVRSLGRHIVLRSTSSFRVARSIQATRLTFHNSAVPRSPIALSQRYPSLASRSINSSVRHRQFTTNASNSEKPFSAINDPTMSNQDGGAASKRKLDEIRQIMSARRLDAYLVPTDDEHGSEYVSIADERRSFLSGFTGSAGQLLVTADAAYLWTDGRYFLQAAKELQIDSNQDEPSAGKTRAEKRYPSSSTTGWTLMKQGLPTTPTPRQLVLGQVRERAGGNVRVGIDPRSIAWWQAETMRKAFKDALKNPVLSRTADEVEAEAEAGLKAEQWESERQVELVAVEENLVDAVWHDQPKRPESRLLVLEDKYAGETFPLKLARIRKEIAKTGASGLVATALDDVAWLFNLRGQDIAYNPVFFAYAIVTAEACTLYLQPGSTTEAVKDHLAKGNVEVKAYDAFFEDLKTWGAQLDDVPSNGEDSDVDTRIRVLARDSKDKSIDARGRVLLGEKASWAVAHALGEHVCAVDGPGPITVAKAIKNEVEIEGFRRSHIRDGAALCRYFAWLDERMNAANASPINEFDAATQLETFRREGAEADGSEIWQGLSFPTISSTGPNAAVIHYDPPETGSAEIDPAHIYLCDSGAQYIDGTTDVTRTCHFQPDKASAHEKRCYTRVLQGHAALDRAVFPAETTGYVLDLLARAPLWSEGLDFGHSTGHGVGSFLNVHEGPHGIGPYALYDKVPLKEGMTISNEPGYYEDGAFGIRIESVVVVSKTSTTHRFRGKQYYRLERLTMAPIQTSLLDVSLMGQEDLKWLDEYHEEVMSKVKPVLERLEDARALRWLERECKPVSR